ncbi:MAG: type IV secretory system conjugative DNA transfer family protein [Bacilli bacterium]|nr:type IV secretory system conjugative DNA transfer family protein [Bacilli bacterium]
MKFKFRADPEDITIFAIFAIFLLYIVAIGVLNLHSFATEGYLYGLNPIPAFFPQFIGATLLLYIFALVGIFASVGSYFFEMEEGFGFSTSKKDKGYSRWAKEKEIQQEKNVEVVNMKNPREKAAGVPLLYKGSNVWIDNGENHTLVIGATGSGKTQCIILPTVKLLAKKRESMIITDPKGEIYEKTSNMLRAKGYQILLLNFRDPQNGNAWNPMSLPYKIYKQGNQDKAIELLDDLALNILYDDSNKNADPFWEKTSADYFSGVALGLFEDAKEEEININSVSLATTIGEEKFGGSTYIKEYFAEKDPASAAAINAQSTIMAPTDTKGSILAVFKQKVKLFASRANLSEMLSHSDINLESIGEKPTAVYIVIQDEKKTYHSLVTILLKQIYETLIGVAQRHGGKLPVRTNFLLDEFANMPPLKDVTTMITAARSRQIRFTMIIQNFAQLDSVYGKEDAETLRGNCGNIIYLVTTELKALEEISKMCGEVKSKKDDKTASTPLVTVSDLQRMKENDVILMRLRMNPFKTHFTPDWKCDWGKKYPEAKYPSRKKREVHTFDIKEFVKERKKKKLLDMMNANSSDEVPGIPNNREQIGPHPNMMNQRVNPFESRPQNIPASNPFESRRPAPIEDDDDDDNGGFDVDELVRKIDAKIAELEKEEQKDKEKNKTIDKNDNNSKEDVQDNISKESTNDSNLQSESKKEPNLNVNQNIDLELDDDDDDEFFDDFFDN